MCLASFSPAQAADITLSSAVLINSSNISTYNGKSIGGTIPSDSSAGTTGDFISKGAIVVDGIELNLTIENLNVDYSGQYSMLSGISLVNGAKLHLTVNGTNNLKAGYGGAGIAVPDGTALEITAQSSGTLNVTGGRNYGGGAGIGSIGNRNSTADVTNLMVPQGLGDITINGGTVNAQGGTHYRQTTPAGGAAGIGSSEYSGATTSPSFKDNRYLNNITGSVTINGGTVSATGGDGSAGIGGGEYGTLKTITITGGTVTATGGDMGAAIGLGANGFYEGTGTLTCPAISITAGTVTANGNIGYGMTMDWAVNQNVGGSVTIGSTATLKCTGKIAPYEAASIPSNSYVDADGRLQQAQNTTSAFGADTWNEGWYVVDQYTEITPRIIVNGTVNLILNDGATLKANGGIHVYKGNTLNIYAQMNGTGKIVAAGGSGNAGIGGGSVRNRTSNPQYDRSCGTINIYGGTVEATGGTDAAGIGCGAIYQDTTDGGTINIHGGTVTATGGKSGAGIGGGKVYDAGKFTNLQNVNISGGTVTATGGKSAAGIGGGYKCPGGTVTITGGNVTATTKYSSNNGIGNGDLAYSATIKLGWTKRTDSIYSGQYNGDVTLTKDFMLKGTSTQATTGNIGGQTIVPPVSVTFDANGGSGTMDAVKSAYGHSYTLPECTFTPKKGQGFDYWLIGDVEYSEGGSLDVTSDIVVKTVWKETDRTVTFDANGHGTAPDAQTVDYAKTMDEPTAPTADGYTFGGWYKEADCVNRWNFAADTVTEDMTLYAKWAVNAYTISYELDGGIDATNNPLIYTTEDSTITLEAPTKTGYTFKGWTPDGTIPSGSTGNKTFTATWEINKYTITFETWGGTQVDSITQDYSTDVTAPSTTPTKRGAVFSEWENMPSKMPAENITVNAVWRTLYHYEAREATCFEEGISECWYLYGNYYTETLSDGVYTYTLMTDSPVTPKVTHSYGEPDSDSWTWFTDSYSGEIAARLTLTCPTCHTSVSINTSEGEVTSEVTTEPTDDDEGVMTYTATVTVDADSYNTAETKTYTGTHTEPIPKTTKIARIGDTWYPSLGAALDAADDDDVIVLSVDVYEPNTECDTGYKNITLDLNGHEVTLKSLNAEYSLTVKNGTLTCYVNNSNSGNDHTLTLDNAELVCRENEMNYGIQWMANNIVLSNDSKMYVIGNVFLGGSDFTMSIDRTSTMELYDATISTYSPARVGEQLSPYLPEGYTLDTTSEQETVHVLYNGEEYHGEATFGLFSLFVWFDSNGGSYVAPQTFKLNRGDEAQATEPVAPTREGYEFVEWQLNGTAYDFSEAVTGDLVLTAKWKFAPSDSNKPQFAYHSLILSGQIGVIFHVYVPEGAVSKDYCTYFDVSGDKSQNTQPVYPFEEFTEDGNKFFGFKCYINSVQMADEIHAVLNYGNDKTLDYTYTAKRYLDSLIADTTQSEDVTELGRAIKDYGSYVQPILAEENHWEVGKKHAKMDAAYDFDDTDFETVSNDTKDYAIVCNVPEGSGIEDVSFALVLDSETAIEIYLASKDGYTGTVCAYIGTNTTDNMAVKKGSEYVISIGNVSAHLLGREYTVNVATGDVNFDVKISALSYVQSAIHDKSEAMKRAVTSLYRYWKATMTYRSKRSEYQ